MRYVVLVLIILVVWPTVSGCLGGGDGAAVAGRDYRQSMRNFVRGLSSYGRNLDPDFIVIPQNGHELLTSNGAEDGAPAAYYIAAIDGVGREDLFYGYDNDDVATPSDERDYMLGFMNAAEQNGVEVLVTDYCSSQAFVDDSFTQSAGRNYISFAADQRELNSIPTYPADPYNVNSDNVTSLTAAKNFLYLINPDAFGGKQNFLDAVATTNYDVLIIDLFYGGGELLPVDVASLRTKDNGGSRLVIAYMSIGEAEDYRYYWQAEWAASPPSWLAGENPDWPGNYKVRYWNAAWQDIIFGGNGTYTKKIIDAGFDGVYLDIIDAFEYFE